MKGNILIIISKYLDLWNQDFYFLYLYKLLHIYHNWNFYLQVAAF